LNKDKMKQSLLMGALTSSFGVFVSKLLGLIYYSPLSSIAGESNMYFYSAVYTYYETLLQISSAGIPFAIAALVAKYIAKNDYKTALLVKKLGTSLIMSLSVVVGFILVLIATPLAKQSLGASAPMQDIEYLKTLFYILTVAVIAVPFLSSIRGYSQGLKRLDIYAGSQVLEQFIRVLSIVLFGYILVNILKMKSIWAIYVAIAAASLGAIGAIVFTKLMQRRDEQHILDLAKQQDFDNNYTKKEVFIELISIGLPYVLISFLSNGAALINTTFFLDYMAKAHGASAYEAAKLSAGILQANVTKLSNIPSVLALGFGSGMVPYLTEALESNDHKLINKDINQILDAVLFILIPVIMIFTIFAKDIYFIMYGNNNLELGTKIFRISNIQTFLATVCPILTSIMITLRLKKQTMLTLIVCILIKYLTFFPFVKLFKVYGMIYSGCLYYGLQCVAYLIFLKIIYKVNIQSSLKRVLVTLLCSIISLTIPTIIYILYSVTYTSRLIDIVYMGVIGILILVVYIFITIKTGLLENVFNIEKPSFKSLLARLRS